MSSEIDMLARCFARTLLEEQEKKGTHVEVAAALVRGAVEKGSKNEQEMLWLDRAAEGISLLQLSAGA